MHVIVRPNPRARVYAPRKWWEWLLYFWKPRTYMAVNMPDGSVVCHPRSVPIVLVVLRANGHTCEVKPQLRTVK